MAWSPQQIARRLQLDFPGDKTMRISHEAIYQALYIQGRGALKRELTACLRTGRALRVPRTRARGRGKSFIASEILSAAIGEFIEAAYNRQRLHSAIVYLSPVEFESSQPRAAAQQPGAMTQPSCP